MKIYILVDSWYCFYDEHIYRNVILHVRQSVEPIPKTQFLALFERGNYQHKWVLMMHCVVQ